MLKRCWNRVHLVFVVFGTACERSLRKQRDVIAETREADCVRNRNGQEVRKAMGALETSHQAEL